MIFSAKKNPENTGKHRQFIVVGVQRGGTSAIAAALQALGISLGDNYHSPIYEDLEMAKAFRSGNWKKLQQLIMAYEQEYQQFAWKLPDSNSKLARISRLFSNPSFIFVYRDICAIANRKQSVQNVTLVEAMKSSLTAYNRIVKFVEKNDYPALHISYEKLLQDTQGHLRQIADFCDIDVTGGLIDQASRAIEASPKIYTQWVDISRQIYLLNKAGFDGYIDKVSENLVSGWFLQKGSDQPVTVELLVNDHWVADFLCEEFRGDLITAEKSVTGKAGFRIPVPKGTLARSDTVSVRPKGHSTSLFSIF